MACVLQKHMTDEKVWMFIVSNTETSHHGTQRRPPSSTCSKRQQQRDVEKYPYRHSPYSCTETPVYKLPSLPSAHKIFSTCEDTSEAIPTLDQGELQQQQSSPTYVQKGELHVASQILKTDQEEDKKVAA